VRPCGINSSRMLAASWPQEAVALVSQHYFKCVTQLQQMHHTLTSRDERELNCSQWQCKFTCAA
jgi:hypothetical protein